MELKGDGKVEGVEGLGREGEGREGGRIGRGRYARLFTSQQRVSQDGDANFAGRDGALAFILQSLHRCQCSHSVVLGLYVSLYIYTYVYIYI